MKKTLIASAIAATFAGNTMAMDNASDIASRLDSMPTVYGNIQLFHESTDNGDNTAHEFKDNGSTIGFKHKHAVSESMTAFLKAEFEFSADNKKESAGIKKLDEAYIGVKGDFGSVQVGSDDTVYEWVDKLDTFEAVGIAGEIASLQEGDNLQYVSPEIAEGMKIGLTAPFDSDSTFGGALAAKYAVDNLELVLAYAMGREEAGKEAGDSIGLAASFKLDDLTLITQYETKSEGVSNSDDGEAFWGLQGVYSMGQNTFALGYSMNSYDFANAEDQSNIYLQALHNLSDNAYVYLEYLAQTDIEGTQDNDLDTLAIGATYAF